MHIDAGAIHGRLPLTRKIFARVGVVLHIHTRNASTDADNAGDDDICKVLNWLPKYMFLPEKYIFPSAFKINFFTIVFSISFGYCYDNCLSLSKLTLIFKIP